MIRKRIEIVSRILAFCMALCAGPAMAESGRQAGREAGVSATGWQERAYPAARAFPVDLPSSAPPLSLAPLPGVPVADAAADTTASAPDIPYSYFWTPQDGLRERAREYVLRQRISEHSPGLLGGFEPVGVATPRSRWLARPGAGGWALGASNWQNRLDDNTELRLGSSEIAVPEWNESVRLGGVSLSQSFLAASDDVSEWNYSLAFGAVDQSSSGSSDLVFGPTAGSLAVGYDYNPRLSMETHTEVAADLVMSGVSGQYDLGDFGRWRSGIARSTNSAHQGWRYRAMADFDLAQDMSLAWMGERYTDGFMDIRRYAAGSASAAGARQRWSASWDVGRWGEWSGSFESVHNAQGTQQRRFGLSQQFWYSPNLRVGVHAEREVVGGDYDIGLRFTFPLY